MITINSLRLGNSLYQSKVVEIHQNRAVVKSTLNGQEDKWPFSALQPILVHQDILKTIYGFTEQEGADGLLYCAPGFCLRQGSGGWIVSSSFRPETRTFYFLHELENIHFALNHQEISAYDDGKLIISQPSEGIQTQLRIGNLVFGKRVSGSGEEIIRVHELRRSGIIYNEFRGVHTGQGVEIRHELATDDPMLYGWASGIQLIPEWVHRLGFTLVSEQHQVYRFGKYTVRLSNKQAVLQQEAHHFGQPFQYIHQLQNLYYALTGNELPIVDL